MADQTMTNADESLIDLAREPSFRVGALEVRPSSREVAQGDRREVIEPRIMQVLVALARRRGEVVSRDELVAACWGGRVVSDDAINRAIMGVRRLAASWPEPPFEITTIAGVGYRLEAAPPEAGPARARRPHITRMRVVAAIACLVVAVGVWAAVAWINWRPPMATPVVEVRAFSVIGDDPALRPIAARAADSIAAFLGDSDVRVIAVPSPTQGGPAKAHLAFGGAVSNADGQLRLHLLLEDTRTGTTLWSRDYDQPATRSDALIDEAKGAAIEVTNLLRPAYGPSGLFVDSESLLHGIRGAEDAVLSTSEGANDAVHEYELALARDPNSPILRAAYSNGLVLAGLNAPPPERAGMFEHARAEAQRVIREHPAQSGLAYWTLLMVAQTQAPRDWVDAQARLDRALKVSPEDPFLNGYACGFLQNVGRAHDSLYYCQRALAVRPHTAPFLLQYAQGLDMQGRRPDADALLTEGARLFPNYTAIQFYRLAREAFGGSPDKARALLRDTAIDPELRHDFAPVELLVTARKSGLPSDADAAMASLRAATQHELLHPWRVAFPMALGRLDDAFTSPDISVFEVQYESALMWAATDPLRRDPRFWPLAARAGLVRYWLTTDKWPDFCSDPSYPLDCRAEARRVSAASPADR